MSFLKRGLLLFWALWLTVVFTTNLLDGLKALEWLGKDWALASGNYQFIGKTTAHYGAPAWLNGLLFAGVIGWEGTAAVLFWRAWYLFRRPGEAAAHARSAAFIVSLALWAAFMITDEVLIAYPVEDVHRSIFIAELATLLAVYLLPEREPGGGGP